MKKVVMSNFQVSRCCMNHDNGKNGDDSQKINRIIINSVRHLKILSLINRYFSCCSNARVTVKILKSDSLIIYGNSEGSLVDFSEGLFVPDPTSSIAFAVVLTPNPIAAPNPANLVKACLLLILSLIGKFLSSK